MSLEEPDDIVAEFEEYYKEVKGGVYGSNAVETLRRNLPAINSGLKNYAEENPYMSSVNLSDLRSELPENYHLGGDISFPLLVDFLDYAECDGLLDESIPGDRYGLNREKILQEQNPIDELIEDIDLKEPIPAEMDVAEYVIADLYRDNGESPQRTEVRSGMEEILGYELDKAQVEHRALGKERITINRTGGGVENSFSFQR